MHECSSRLASRCRFCLSRESALAVSQRPKPTPKYARLRRTRSAQFSSTAHDSLSEFSATIQAPQSKSVLAPACLPPTFSCTQPGANRNTMFPLMPCSSVLFLPEKFIACPPQIRASSCSTAWRGGNYSQPSRPELNDEPRLPGRRLEPPKAFVRHRAGY